MLGEGLVHILATDCHSAGRRVPVMSEGLAVAEKIVGAAEARRLVQDRPEALLRNLPPSQVPPLPEHAEPAGARLRGWLRQRLRL
jgi:protein-tyrosine phosphatase